MIGRRVVALVGLAIAAAAVACSSSCPPPAAAGAATASEAEQNAPEVLAEAEGLARDVCDCPSALCADSAAASFVDLLRRRGDNLEVASRDRLLALSEKVLGCRVRLAYPSEPVDMDGAVEPAGGASGADAGSTGPGSGAD